MHVPDLSQIVKAPLLLWEALRAVHSIEYLDFVSRQPVNVYPTLHTWEQLGPRDRFGMCRMDEAKRKRGALGDCPIFPHMDHYMRAVAGASVAGVFALLAGEANVVFHLAGGLHHGMRDKVCAA